jgi:hypothetical protein
MLLSVANQHEAYERDEGTRREGPEDVVPEVDLPVGHACCENDAEGEPRSTRELDRPVVAVGVSSRLAVRELVEAPLGALRGDLQR